MTTKLEQGQYSPVARSDAIQPHTHRQGSYQCKGTSSRCSQAAKNCFTCLYGRPYPPLSQRQVREYYCVGGAITSVSLAFGSLILGTILSSDATTTEASSKAIPMAVSLVAGVFLTTASLGLNIIYKTYNAPKTEAVNEALTTAETPPQPQDP